MLNYSALIREISYLSIGKLLKTVVFLITTIYLARYLGPENYGIYSYVIAIVMIFNSVAKLGLNSILTLNVANNYNGGKLLLSSIILQIIAGVFGAIILLLYSTNLSSTKQTGLVICCITLPFISAELTESYFVGKQRSKISVRRRMLHVLISSFLKIYLILEGFELKFFFYAFLFDAILLSILFYFPVKNEITSSNYRYVNFKFLLRQSWPIWITSIFTLIYMRVDTLMINLIIDDYATGIYSSSVRIIESIILLPSIASTALLPYLKESKNVSIDFYNKRLSLFFKIALLGSSIFSILMWFYGDNLVSLVYGESFVNDFGLFSILSLCLIPISLGLITDKHILVEGLQKKIIHVVLIGAATNTILNWILISKMGIKGAAIATLISYLLNNFFIFFLFKDLKHIPKIILKIN